MRSPSLVLIPSHRTPSRVAAVLCLTGKEMLPKLPSLIVSEYDKPPFKKKRKKPEDWRFASQKRMATWQQSCSFVVGKDLFSYMLKTSYWMMIELSLKLMDTIITQLSLKTVTAASKYTARRVLSIQFSWRTECGDVCLSINRARKKGVCKSSHVSCAVQDLCKPCFWSLNASLPWLVPLKLKTVQWQDMESNGTAAQISHERQKADRKNAAAVFP